MQNYNLWWPVVCGVAFLAVLILVIILTGDQSPHSKTQKQKQKKPKKHSRSCSPPKTTGHSLKKCLNIFKQCVQCRRKTSVTDTHDLCLVCLGMEHPMLNCNQCMAFTWKTFRGRFLCQFLWVGVTRESKAKLKTPVPPQPVYLLL